MIQAQILNKIIQSGDPSIITLNNLTVDYFSDYADEFLFIKAHLDKYDKIPDKATFLNAFPSFDWITVEENDSYLLEELFRDRNKRFLAEKFNIIRKYLMDDQVDNALAVLKDAAEQTSTSTHLQCVDLLTDTSRYDNYVEKINNSDKYFITTGFKELDDIIGGWDVHEELATIVGRSGKGKSWLLLKCAAAAAMQGKTVGIYSGEMTVDKVGYRIDTLIGHIANGSLIHGGASVKDQYSKYINNIRENVPGSIKVITPQMINGAAGVSALRAFVEKEKLDILFVDQYSLLDDDRKAKATNEKVANISRDLKLLQSLKLIPIISVSQQNREKLDTGGFDTSQVALSDRIAQDSTLIIFIEREDDLFKLHIVKSRDNESGKVLTYRCNLNEGIFDYVPSEKDLEDHSSSYSEDEVF